MVPSRAPPPWLVSVVPVPSYRYPSDEVSVPKAALTSAGVSRHRHAFCTLMASYDVASGIVSGATRRGAWTPCSWRWAIAHIRQGTGGQTGREEKGGRFYSNNDAFVATPWISIVSSNVLSSSVWSAFYLLEMLDGRTVLTSPRVTPLSLSV